MKRAELLATVERLCSTDVDALDRDELADVMAAGASVRGWLDALDLRCTRQGRALAEAGRAESAADMIVVNSNRSSREAVQIARRGDVADAMPVFEDGLDDGTVSAGHLDAIANATRTAPTEVRTAFAMHDDELVAHARADTIEAFTRRCRALVARLTDDLTGNDSSELDRQRAASRIRRRVDPADGMHHTDISLDPLRDEILWNTLNRKLRSLQQRDGNTRTPWQQLQVDALMSSVVGDSGSASSTASNSTTAGPTVIGAGAGATTTTPSPAAGIARDLAAAVDAAMPGCAGITSAADLPNRVSAPDGSVDGSVEDSGEREPQPVDRQVTPITEVSLLIDLTTLVDGLHANSVCETEDGRALPVSTVRRLCCDAEIIPIVLGGNGEALDVGRSKRTVNRAQRRALRAMHRTCAHPLCTVPFSSCKIHHVRWWWRDRGATDIDNLLPLCEPHHHLVHEGGWTLTMTPARVATWTRPDGSVHHQGSTNDRRPDSQPSGTEATDIPNRGG